MRFLHTVGRLGIVTAMLAACSRYEHQAAPNATALSAGPAQEAMPRTAHDTEAYDVIDENPFLDSERQPLSTFAIDVDTASYSNVRRFLNQGQLPPKDAVRIEELINYFEYDYDAPEGKAPFAVHSELSSAPWNAKHQLLRLAVQAQRIPDAQLPARNLVFLLDVSGSMSDAHKLPLLKRSLHELASDLRAEDHVAIVVYAGSSGLVLPPTRGDDAPAIMAALDRLEAGGSTNGGEGIELAYRVAREHFDANGVNRVILATDGDFNVGTTSEGELVRKIEKERASGVYLTVLGFGMGNLKDSTLEKLADRGNGNYAYIDDIAEARKVLVQQAGGTLVTVAEDVKLQLEFNPTVVAGYRLIGYENRVLQARDFNDDRKDAGEIGAGHSVTALYELVPVGQAVPGSVDALKYQKPSGATPAANAPELGTLKLRYKAPHAQRSELMTFTVPAAAAALADTSPGYRFASGVALFGMMLRDSPHRGQGSFALVHELITPALAHDARGYGREFAKLVVTAERLKGNGGALAQ